MNIDNMKSLVKEFLEGSLTRYQQDLEAIPADKFAVSPGGSARSAADFTLECITLNIRFAAVLRKQEPEPMKWAGWTRAEGDMKERAQSCAAFKSSADELLAAFEALNGEGLEEMVTAFRNPTPAYELAHFAAVHINYHDAQLNLLQALYGDEEMHWG
jgi:hypothetical protein